MGPHRTPTRRHHPRRTNRRIIGTRHTRQSRPTSRSQRPTAPTISPTNRRQNPQNPHPLPILTPQLTHQSKRFFWGATPIGGLLPPIRLRCRAIAYRQYARLSVLCSRQPACADYLRAYARFFWGYAPMRSPNTRAGAQSSPKTKKCGISRCSSPMAHKAIPKTKNAASHRGK